MAEKDKIILPEKYYLDNFKYVLNFVLDKYEPLLSYQEVRFITDFMSFSEDGQCLYVRISNRKGQFFRKEKLVYAEIVDLDTARSELLDAGFLLNKNMLEIDECYQLLSIYNKSELIKSVKAADIEIDKSLKKDELILSLMETVPSDDLHALFYSDDILTQGVREELDMVKLFFFGHNHGDMSDFVIRDVGHARFMEVDESALGTSFDSREEAEAVMHLSRLNKEFYLLEETLSPLSVYEWFSEVEVDYFLGMTQPRPRIVKLIHKVGYLLEKNKHYDEALAVYHLTNDSPMRERKIRIYNKLKAFEDSLSVAHQILESPNDNKEYYIALDVINKLDKKLKTTTIRQKDGLVIQVSDTYMYQVEKGALAYFESMGFTGYHSENSIGRNLFGLFFWEEIFDPQYNSLHQPLQRAPSDIYGGDFYSKRKQVIEKKLQKTKTKKQIDSILNNSINNYSGITNPFVNWDKNMLTAMTDFVSRVTPKQIKSLLAEIAIDPKTRSTGFPDLFVWKGDDYSFYEVKSPNDHLSEKQLFWLEKFDQWGINAEIALVEWVD